MNKILEKRALNPTVTLMKVEAPLVARKAEPGQFIILRADENGERIPLTVADFDREAGTVTIIFQIVGAATATLNHLKEGEFIHDFVGPLGRPTHTEGLKKVAVVGGGVGCAIAYPVAKKLYSQGTVVHSITGFRNRDLVILEQEFEAASDKVCRMSDDGSWGEKGLVTDQVVLTVGYDIESVTADYKGEVTQDWYGRKIPKQAHGSENIGQQTSSTKKIMDAMLRLYDRIVDPKLLVRRMYVVANHVVPEESVPDEPAYEQMDLFADYEALQKQKEEEEKKLAKEKRLQSAMLSIKQKYGKNSILHGTSYEEGATGRDRNQQIGGHKA